MTERKPTQTDRLIAWLHANPGASSLEITLALRVVNVTGRISDARAKGVDIECRVIDGTSRYYIVDLEPVQVALFFGGV
jgi:hypothetical protein